VIRPLQRFQLERDYGRELRLRCVAPVAARHPGAVRQAERAVRFL